MTIYEAPDQRLILNSSSLQRGTRRQEDIGLLSFPSEITFNKALDFIADFCLHTCTFLILSFMLKLIIFL